MQIYIHIFLFCCFTLSSQGRVKMVLNGYVVNENTNESLPFATVLIRELEKGVMCNVDGRFNLEIDHQRQISIEIRSLGYVPKIVKVKANSDNIKIALKPQSIKLDNVVVSAKYQPNSGSDAKIDQEALEYIQPTSLRDIFLLLPGEIMGSNNMQTRSYISSRQAGSDQSTSFGMGVSTDGVPSSNDGMRIQMGGFTGKTSIDPNGNVAINAGTDLRTISTDHIESVTIKKGIASAKEGNLSSGLIQITSKKGITPLRVRTKIDPLNKLLYVGKGFKLSDRLGLLHVGADLTQSASDIRDVRSAYNRVTGQMTHSNMLSVAGKKIELNQRFSYVTSFNNDKNDKLYEKYGEQYNTNYSRYTYAIKALANLNTLLVDELELVSSVDYSTDVLEHVKYVENPSVLIIQPSTNIGENEGEYLPSKYVTEYSVENKPLNIFASINASKIGSISDVVNYTVLLGNSVSMTKNYGAGAIADPMRPPFPTNDFIRARPNYEIPAIAHSASYLDTKLRCRFGDDDLNLALGVRGTKMLNLPSKYALSKVFLIEPRTQLSYTNRAKIAGKYLSNTFRIGYGVENKLPSMDYLYPDDIYQDFIILNAYFTDPSKRLLLTETIVHSTLNPDIRENKNTKIELGWDVTYNGFDISLTLFKEQMNGGTEYFSQYSPVEYMYYNELKHPVDTKPSKDDFYSYLHRDFTTSSKPVNSAKVEKTGIEYRISIPKIEAIKTSFEINGAYYKTLYTSGVPVMYRPSITQNNKPYEYVGIYDGFDKQYSSRFNTNIWMHTHIPIFKLIFTNFIQMIWYQSSQLGDNVSAYPSRYMNLAGDIMDITPEQIDKDSKFSSLKREFNSSKYNEKRIPFALQMNMKVTKEFGKSIRLSFFANNLIQINPEYKNEALQTRREWLSPFFGAELAFNL